MTALLITTAVLAWFGCGLLAVYLFACRYGKPDDPTIPTVCALLGPVMLVIAAADYAADAGARRHREGK